MAPSGTQSQRAAEPIHRSDARRTVALGSLAGPSTAQLTFARAVETELQALQTIDVRPDEHAEFVVRGSVVRLTTGVEHSDCEVSLIIAERRNGAIRGALQGRARVEDHNVWQARQRSVEAAVRGALRGLPDALRGAATTTR